MRAEVLSWCRREALFSPGAQVVCAVSGGADSMAMLCCLRELAAELSVYVRAAHFNHRLRGAESDGDEAFVRAFCAAEGIELVCGAPEKPARSEEEAREQRYAFLDSIPCDAVAIAHTAEDNLETLLQHLLRGSGLRGLGGIPPRRGRYVRPLLAVSHAQAREYLRARGTGWREDATNAEDSCQRNRLRHGVLPLLAAVEGDPDIHGLLILLNNAGGDVEAGLAIAELIASMSKPTASLVLGGSHSIGVPLAVAARRSFIAPSAAMTVHPVRLTGLVIGAPQTFYYFERVQERIVRFVTGNSHISREDLTRLMLRTDELAADVGSILYGEEAVQLGLIDQLGGLTDALDWLYQTMGKKKTT